MEQNKLFQNPTQLIEKIRYEKEKSRYKLAILGIAPILLFFLMLIVSTFGMALLFIAVYGVIIFLMMKFVGKIIKTSFLMDLIEVNEDNFSNLYDSIDVAKQTIKYNVPIKAYIWKGSKFGLSIVHLLDRKILVFDASVLEDNPSKEILDFLIMFHISRLKTRSEYFSILTKIISGIERVWILNFLLYPFERATVYTADRIAMLYAGSAKDAQSALLREIIGSQLSSQVNISSVVNQGEQARGFFSWLVRSYSSTPSYAHRFQNLQEFNNNKDKMIEDLING